LVGRPANAREDLMELRIVVPDATSATALADRLIVAFGSAHVSLRDGRREVDVRIDREPDSAILRALESVERWLDPARVGSVETWLGGRSYRFARWAPTEIRH
jgi:hypothetical protein